MSFKSRKENAFANILTPQLRSIDADFVRHLLRQVGTSRDALPYSVEFDQLKARYEQRTKQPLEDAQFWRILEKVGKRGGISKGKRRLKPSPSPRISRQQQLELLRLLPDGIGHRDQFPYTPAFDDLYQRFSRLTRTRFSKHEFWRVLSRVAKKSRKPQPLFDSAPLGGLASELVQLLESQNPWWKGQPQKPIPTFRRWACDEVMRRLHSGIAPVVSLRGPRQVGKSTVQEQLIEELLRLRQINPARILRVQFDDVPALGNFKNPIAALVKWYETNVLRDTLNATARRGEPAYLFFDEVQNLRTWDTQLKSLVDTIGTKTLVTGSSALRIAGGHDSLVGRVTMLEMGPLRLHEIVGMRRLGSMAPFQPAVELEAWTKREFWLDLLKHFRQHERTARKAFEAFSDLGGYPVCHNANETISNLADHILEMVVKRTFTHDLNAGPGGKRRDRRVLEETFKRICRYAGQAVRVQRIREELEHVLGPGVRPKPIMDAIRFLADALLIHEIPPFEALTKKQAHPGKFCLCDHFVREAWLQERIPIAPSQLKGATEAVSTLAGHIMESVIGFYFKGIPGLDLSWFPERRDEPEVDYVLTIAMLRIPVEIKYQRELKQKDYQGVRSFCGRLHYNAPFGLVITQEASGEVGDSVIAVPACALLALH